MLQKQCESLKIAWGERLSHHTCKVKSWAPPGMHSIRVIHHIRHYQSYNDGFTSTPMLSFPSDFFLQIINSLSPLQVLKHWSSLKVREVFLWPEGHIVWDLHQSALEQHIALSLAPVQLLRTVWNHFSPVVTANPLKFINNDTSCLQGSSGVNLSLKQSRFRNIKQQ